MLIVKSVIPIIVIKAIFFFKFWYISILLTKNHRLSIYIYIYNFIKFFSRYNIGTQIILNIDDNDNPNLCNLQNMILYIP